MKCKLHCVRVLCMFVCTHAYVQVYDTSNAAEPQGPAGVKVKASQCFTKVGACLCLHACVSQAYMCSCVS